MGSLVAHTILITLLGIGEPLALPARAALDGHIYDQENGQPLARAVVRVQGMELETHTGRDGAFHLGALPPGVYTVTVRRQGYLSHRIHDVRVRTRWNAALHVHMLKADDLLMLRRAEVSSRSFRNAAVHVPARTSDRAATPAPRRGALHRHDRAARE